MRYQSHECSGLVKSGVNMCPSSRIWRRKRTHRRPCNAWMTWWLMLWYMPRIVSYTCLLWTLPPFFDSVPSLRYKLKKKLLTLLICHLMNFCNTYIKYVIIDLFCYCFCRSWQLELLPYATITLKFSEELSKWGVVRKLVLLLPYSNIRIIKGWKYSTYCHVFLHFQVLLQKLLTGQKQWQMFTVPSMIFRVWWNQRYAFSTIESEPYMVDKIIVRS